MAAEYRSVQTRIWREDEWFLELDTAARLFWIYLFTNPSASAAGIYRLPLRTMANESGLSIETVRRLLAQFSAAGKAHYENGTVWVVNMRRLQFPTLIDGSHEWQTAIRIQRDIDAIPDRCPLKARYLAHSGYPTIVETGKTRTVKLVYPSGSDTPSIPHQSGIDTPPIHLTKLNLTEDDDSAAVSSDSLKVEPQTPEEAPADPPTSVNPDFGLACRLYEEKIGGTLTSTVSDQIGALVDDCVESMRPFDWFGLALDVTLKTDAARIAAGEQGIDGKWAYAQTVLTNALRTGRPPEYKEPTNGRGSHRQNTARRGIVRDDSTESYLQQLQAAA